MGEGVLHLVFKQWPSLAETMAWKNNRGCEGGWNGLHNSSSLNESDRNFLIILILLFNAFI